ncbi:hypothetical protein BC833DRAFT_593036 [Globomyces pollinis-pini]|nr:hypothetical protein BC833DRAFT_593036 [Globomyces pollinis-pini]
MLLEFNESNYNKAYIVANIICSISLSFGLWHTVSKFVKFYRQPAVRAYQKILLILICLSLLIVANQLIQFNLPGRTTIGVHQIYLVLTNWPDFFYVLCMMLADMEMLRLLQSIAPQFTDKVITLVQIVEIIVAFSTGGVKLLIGLIPWTELLAKWYSYGTPLYYLIGFFVITIQCSFISYKMYIFSKKKSSSTEIKSQYQKTIRYIILFWSLTMLDSSFYVMVETSYRESDLTGYQSQICKLGYAIALSYYPFMVYLYTRIFQTIREIKFDKKATVHAVI